MPTSGQDEGADERRPLCARGRASTILRWLLAGPVAAIVAVLVLTGMPLYLPPGEGNVDHIVVPLVMLPIVWAALFFHAILDRSLVRVAGVAVLVASPNLALLANRFLS